MPSRATRNALIAAASNLSTAYNLVVINIVHVIVQNQYCGGAKCKGAVNLASTAVLVGAIIGQLTFGYIGDCLGRSAALQLTMKVASVLDGEFTKKMVGFLADQVRPHDDPTVTHGDPR